MTKSRNNRNCHCSAVIRRDDIFWLRREDVRRGTKAKQNDVLPTVTGDINYRIHAGKIVVPGAMEVQPHAYVSHPSFSCEILRLSEILK